MHCIWWALKFAELAKVWQKYLHDITGLHDFNHFILLYSINHLVLLYSA